MSRRIKIDPRNFNRHTESGMALLESSIKEVGAIESICIDKKGEIISGNARFETFEKLGFVPKIIELGENEYPVIQTELEGEKRVKAAILANTTSQKNINLDIELIQEVAIEEFKINIEEIGVDEKYIKNKYFVEDDDFNVLDNIETTIEQGDLFEISHNGMTHRLLCGDATKKEDVERLMNGEKGDMIFIDPPYNVKISSILNSGSIKHMDFKFGFGEMNETEFIEFLKKAFKNLVLFSKDGSIHYICMDWKHIYEIITAGRSQYTELKNLCIWNKDNGCMGTFYRNKHELIFVFKNGTEKHTNTFELGQNGRYRTNVWDYAGVNSFKTMSRELTDNNRIVSKVNEDLKIHPTVKPLPLVSDAILDCSLHGEIIIDTFGGSGTTLIAAAKTERRCYMMEYEPKYCQTILDRFKKNIPNAIISNK